MYNNYSILAIIPARAGSKGIKNKNVIDFAGKPLIAYSIEAARNCKYIDRVIVSTDGETIAEVSKRFEADVPFLRPKELASDNSKTIDAIVHAINSLSDLGFHYDVLVLLQPTSPLRTAEDINAAVETFFNCSQQPLASVSEVDDHPLLVRSIEDGFLHRLIDENSTQRRQDMKEYYRVNGAIYMNRIKDINGNTSFNDNSIPYLMKKSHSVDIDTDLDFIIAESIYKSEYNAT